MKTIYEAKPSPLARLRSIAWAIIAIPALLLWAGVVAAHQAIGSALTKLGGDQ